MNNTQLAAEELTRLAAIAVGLDLVELEIKTIWVPLEKDHLAFRLLTALKLDLMFIEGRRVVHVSNQEGTLTLSAPYSEADIDERTRFCIVALAAEIGRRMGSKKPALCSLCSEL